MVRRSVPPVGVVAASSPSAVPPERARSGASFARNGVPNADSVAAQHQENRRRAAEDGFVIVAELTLDGLGANTKAYDAFVRFVDEGKARFSRVYMRDRERVARFPHPGLYEAFVNMYLEQGVELVFVADDDVFNGETIRAVLDRVGRISS